MWSSKQVKKQKSGPYIFGHWHNWAPVFLPELHRELWALPGKMKPWIEAAAAVALPQTWWGVQSLEKLRVEPLFLHVKGAIWGGLGIFLGCLQSASRVRYSRYVPPSRGPGADLAGSTSMFPLTSWRWPDRRRSELLCLGPTTRPWISWRKWKDGSKITSLRSYWPGAVKLDTELLWKIIITVYISSSQHGTAAGHVHSRQWAPYEKCIYLCACSFFNQ